MSVGWHVPNVDTTGMQVGADLKPERFFVLGATFISSHFCILVLLNAALHLVFAFCLSGIGAKLELDWLLLHWRRS